MNLPTNKNSQAQKELPLPTVQAISPFPRQGPAIKDPIPYRRRTVPEIFRESMRVYFWPITVSVRIGRKLAQSGWRWLLRR